jgi:hypothetical protein
MRILAAVIALLGFGLSSRAEVIDFETGSFDLTSGQTGTLEGFDFTNDGVGTSPFILVPVTAGGCLPACVSDGTKTLGAFNDSPVTIAPDGGGTFSLSAFDVAGTFASGDDRGVTSMEVIGNLFGGGQTTEEFDGIGPSVFQTLSLDSTFTDLTSAEFLPLTPAGGDSPEYQLDNINVVVSAAPEPGSIILMFGGAILFAGAMMRQQKRAARVAKMSPESR